MTLIHTLAYSPLKYYYHHHYHHLPVCLFLKHLKTS